VTTWPHAATIAFVLIAGVFALALLIALRDLRGRTAPATPAAPK